MGNVNVVRRVGLASFSVALLVIVAVGCSSSTHRTPPTSSQGVPSTTSVRSRTEAIKALTGSSWVPVEVLAGNKTLSVASPGSGTVPNPYIVFTRKGGKFDANDNCNSYLGNVVITPTTVTLGHADGTLVGCLSPSKPGTRSAFETLQQVMVPKMPQQWTIIAGRLHLHTANGETVVFRSQP